MEGDSGMPCAQLRQKIIEQGGWLCTLPEIPTWELFQYIRSVLQLLNCRSIVIDEDGDLFTACCATQVPVALKDIPAEETLVVMVWPTDTDRFFNRFDTQGYKGILVLGPALGTDRLFHNQDVNPYHILEQKAWVSLQRETVLTCSRDDVYSHEAVVNALLSRSTGVCRSVPELFVQYPHALAPIDPPWWSLQYNTKVQQLLMAVRAVSALQLYGTRGLLFVSVRELRHALQTVYAMADKHTALCIAAFAGVAPDKNPEQTTQRASEIRTLITMLAYFETTAVTRMPAALQQLYLDRLLPNMKTSVGNQLALVAALQLRAVQLPTPAPSCAACFSRALDCCKRCKEVYCSRSCQKAHWSVHKQFCVRPS